MHRVDRERVRVGAPWFFHSLTFLRFSHDCGDLEASCSHVDVYLCVCVYVTIRPSCEIDLDTLARRFRF
jgi:hypothetical protein